MDNGSLIHPLFLEEEVVGKKELNLFGVVDIRFDQPSLPISKDAAHGFILVENVKDQTFDHVPFMLVARIDSLNVSELFPYLDRQMLAGAIEKHYSSITDPNLERPGQAFIKKDTLIGGRSFFSSELHGYMVHF